LADVVERRTVAVQALAACEALFWLVTAGILLALVPFRHLFREIPPEAAAPNLAPDSQVLVARVCEDLGRIAARLPWRPACLPKALAGQLMCHVHGVFVPIELSVVVGVPRFGAHARLASGTDAGCAATTPNGRRHLGLIVMAWL